MMLRSRHTLLTALGMALCLALLAPMSASAGSGGDDLDCSDFGSQQEAQAEYLSVDGDPDHLDNDQDGSACEEFDFGDEFDFGLTLILDGLSGSLGPPSG